MYINIYIKVQLYKVYSMSITQLACTNFLIHFLKLSAHMPLVLKLECFSKVEIVNYIAIWEQDNAILYSVLAEFH